MSAVPYGRALDAYVSTSAPLGRTVEGFIAAARECNALGVAAKKIGDSPRVNACRAGREECMRLARITRDRGTVREAVAIAKEAHRKMARARRALAPFQAHIHRETRDHWLRSARLRRDRAEAQS